MCHESDPAHDGIDMQTTLHFRTVMALQPPGETLPCACGFFVGPRIPATLGRRSLAMPRGEPLATGHTSCSGS
jgi:hypothetical protein